VIARAVDDPYTPVDESRRIAVSVISGYRFSGNIGQSVTADMADPNEPNTNGSRYGSRNPQLIGYYEIPVPPGTYTIEVETLDSSFVGGSGIGPMVEPVSGFPPEYWNQNESAFDYTRQRDTVVVNGGDVDGGHDIILNSIWSTYDNYEDGGMVMIVPLLPQEKQNGEGL
jgi:hypothetical protein